MILFRLLSFVSRVFSAFVFVMILQVKWDGKPLEDHLVQFGKGFIVAKVLNQAGENNTKALRKLAEKPPSKMFSRVLNNPFIQSMKQRLSLPADMLQNAQKEPQNTQEEPQNTASAPVNPTPAN